MNKFKWIMRLAGLGMLWILAVVVTLIVSAFIGLTI
jgi:hypothetical protein